MQDENHGRVKEWATQLHQASSSEAFGPNNYIRKRKEESNDMEDESRNFNFCPLVVCKHKKKDRNENTIIKMLLKLQI